MSFPPVLRRNTAEWAMALEVPLALVPMEAKPTNELPRGTGWLLEQKYDGFRCLVFRDGDTVSLQSRRQRPLGRYFPEVVQAAMEWPIDRFVLDGELIIPDQPFDMLQLRLHPAPSRVAKLSQEHPARFIAFDLLADAEGRSLLGRPFSERRRALKWHRRQTPRPAVSARPAGDAQI